MIKVLFKKLRKTAIAPFRAHEGDAGWDVTIPSDGARLSEGMAEYYSGLAVAIPRGYWLALVPRSSVYKSGMVLSNSTGVIDSGYRGEIQARFFKIGHDWHPYRAGDRAFQLILQPALTTDVEFVEVDELPESWDGRGEGGHGSTGA